MGEEEGCAGANQDRENKRESEQLLCTLAAAVRMEFFTYPENVSTVSRQCLLHTARKQIMDTWGW